MKSKPIDFTEEYDDLIKVMRLALFLHKLNIPGAFELSADAEDLHTEVFCDQCENETDHCECNSEGRYMREYDDGADYED